MDLKKVDDIVARADKPVTITIYQPNGEPYRAKDGTEATMDVVGSESKKYRTAEGVIADRMLSKRRAKFSKEDIERNAIFLAASAVVGWHGWEIDGKEAEPSPENVRFLLQYKHIRNQVDEAINGHADFFEGSLDNS